MFKLSRFLGHRIGSHQARVHNDNKNSLIDRSSLLLFAAVGLAGASGTLHPNSSISLAESAEGEIDDNGSTTILNWSGNHSVQLKPGTYHEPESVSELYTLVAEAYRNGSHIRPVGSALSPNGLAFDPRGMVCLSNLDKIIDINKENMTVTVQAGARVSQVIEALRQHGLTLPNLASIAEQQIGGFCSVGAHGTGATIPPCDEFVTGGLLTFRCLINILILLN